VRRSARARAVEVAVLLLLLAAAVAGVVAYVAAQRPDEVDRTVERVLVRSAGAGTAPAGATPPPAAPASARGGDAGPSPGCTPTSIVDEYGIPVVIDPCGP
jgi:hypothetical protein